MNSLKKIFLLVLFIITIGCGTEGKDGEVYLRIRAVLEPTNVIIANPDLPANDNGYFVGDFDVYYKTEEGSYPFSYVDHNGVQHPLLGEYSVVNIFSDKGEKGGLFNSGEDGEDVYVDLILLSTGAVIENYDMFTIASSLDYPE
tara:strand:+ start:113 stop:544 length:432 start_codon:yes stop_codon:yes gene_type:complete